jgi:hypothetical protein
VRGVGVDIGIAPQLVEVDTCAEIPEEQGAKVAASLLVAPPEMMVFRPW